MPLTTKQPQVRRAGECKTCGTAVDKLEHSAAATCMADGTRFVYPDEQDKGWCIFRCRKCSDVIDYSWRMADSKPPNVEAERLP